MYVVQKASVPQKKNRDSFEERREIIQRWLQEGRPCCIYAIKSFQELCQVYHITSCAHRR